MKKIWVLATLFALSPILTLAQSAKPTKTDTTNWTGFYAGLSAGGAIGSSNAQTATGPYSEDGYFNETSIPVVNNAGNQNLTPTGFAGGLQFGYNRQITPHLVAGIEAEYGALSTDDSTSVTAIYPCCEYPFTIQQRVSSNWMSSVRARVGRTVGKNYLLYLTGGGAETQFRYSSDFSSSTWGEHESANAKVLKTGWVVGGGVERSLARHWSTRAEYLHVDFGQVWNQGNAFSVNEIETAAVHAEDTSASPATTFTHTATLSSNIARLAVNYRF